MEYIKKGNHMVFYHNGVEIGSYHEGVCFAIGGTLRLIYRFNRYSPMFEYRDGHRTCSADSKEYAWFVDLYNSIAAGNYVIEGELLTKCLDLYYLLGYRWQKSLSNVYDGNIIKNRNIPRTVETRLGEVRLRENNEIEINVRVYKVSDDFMIKARESEYHDINDAILFEEYGIWRSAFPPKTKSARNCEN
jgi:hypothetical protein